MIPDSFVKHLKKELKKHLFEYLLLLTAGIFFLVLLSIARGSHLRQFMVLVLFISFYVFWGILHHLLDKSFRLKIVLEYILIGAIALFLLQILLL